MSRKSFQGICKTYSKKRPLGNHLTTASPSLLKVIMDVKNLIEEKVICQGWGTRSNGNEIISGTTTIHSWPTVVETIPDNTLYFAEDVSRELKSRREELGRPEECTIHVCDQVCGRLVQLPSPDHQRLGFGRTTWNTRRDEFSLWKVPPGLEELAYKFGLIGVLIFIWLYIELKIPSRPQTITSKHKRSKVRPWASS